MPSVLFELDRGLLHKIVRLNGLSVYYTGCFRVRGNFDTPLNS